MLNVTKNTIKSFFKRNWGVIIFNQIIAWYLCGLSFTQSPHQYTEIVILTPIIMFLINVLIDICIFKD